MPTVRFTRENREIAVADGTTILEAARAVGVEIESPCNAVGTCGKCKVRVDGAEVLACQTSVTRDTDVEVPDNAEQNASVRILTGSDVAFEYAVEPYITKRFADGETRVFGGDLPLGVERGDTTDAVYGIALDIGTTTLVAELIDLKTGAKLASESLLNPQTAFAQDVLTRIHFASETDDGVAILHRAFLAAFGDMRDKLTASARIEPRNIYEVVFSGNTAMLHMAIGVDPAPLGKFPYNSNVAGGEHVHADALGISPFGVIYLPPIISAFVGADITSGILATRLEQRRGTTLFIDIGTNGEMVLASDGRLSATSTAAGPAFEGMNITCGMRAGAGAIEAFHITDDGAITYSTIGNEPAVGICGSGLLDIVAELARTGVVDKGGRFAEKGVKSFEITENVHLTQKDVRQVQLAKGAIRAGLTALLAQLEVPETAVDEVLIAGSFGYHLRESSLLNLGLLPQSFAGNVRFVGNTSQSGAAAYLLSSAFRGYLADVTASVDKVELSNAPGFEKLFIASLGF
ncbi:MAG: ASKHA domain-containing protein [Oscillospiraceae bacterium]|jgi:uncharacterized 2Fe-2S/4Fe-4S cluster protein (DUF4445 family)|nr:ASKHA domain-containing protein [Oscillospiraceae bacterium]